MGRAMIMMSDVMLNTALVIMWFVSAEQFTVPQCQHIVAMHRIAGIHTIGGGHPPVKVERATPNEPQYFHNKEGNTRVPSSKFDESVMP